MRTINELTEMFESSDFIIYIDEVDYQCKVNDLYGLIASLTNICFNPDKGMQKWLHVQQQNLLQLMTLWREDLAKYYNHIIVTETYETAPFKGEPSAGLHCHHISQPPVPVLISTYKAYKASVHTFHDYVNLFLELAPNSEQHRDCGLSELEDHE